MDEKDKAERRKGIGGADVAPILGLFGHQISAVSD